MKRDLLRLVDDFFLALLFLLLGREQGRLGHVLRDQLLSPGELFSELACFSGAKGLDFAGLELEFEIGLQICVPFDQGGLFDEGVENHVLLGVVAQLFDADYDVY